MIDNLIEAMNNKILEYQNRLSYFADSVLSVNKNEFSIIDRINSNTNNKDNEFNEMNKTTTTHKIFNNCTIDSSIPSFNIHNLNSLNNCSENKSNSSVFNNNHINNNYNNYNNYNSAYFTLPHLSQSSRSVNTNILSNNCVNCNIITDKNKNLSNVSESEGNLLNALANFSLMPKNFSSKELEIIQNLNNMNNSNSISNYNRYSKYHINEVNNINNNNNNNNIGSHDDEVDLANPTLSKIYSTPNSNISSNYFNEETIKDNNDNKENKDIQTNNTIYNTNNNTSNNNKDTTTPERSLYQDFSLSSNKDSDIYSNLTYDIISFKHYNKQQIDRIKPKINSILDKINQITNTHLPEYEIVTYGSYSTNLALQWSDLDLVLQHKKNMPSHIALKTLYEYLRSQHWIKSSKIIENTHIPIIKLVANEELNNIQIDISLKDQKHLGLKCIKLVNWFKSEYHCLSYLVISLKQILKLTDLNDPFKGGISSYGLILLVVYFLQNYGKIYRLGGNNYDINSNYNYGKIFCDFFDYFGNYFDNKKFIVLARCKSEFSDKSNTIYNNSVSELYQ